jgi:16S rRNA (cytidine1402-2'-O)-methyltransferase
VATPIGNLGDMSTRAVTVLGGADTVLCEDTRRSGRLMAAMGLDVRLKPYHEHNAARVRPGLIEALRGGARLALISDAGMPAIADPGQKLVKEAIEAGVHVSAVPGPSPGSWRSPSRGCRPTATSSRDSCRPRRMRGERP